MSTVRNTPTFKYFVILFIAVFSFSCKDDDGVIGDPRASAHYYIENNSKYNLTCKILDENRYEYIPTDDRVEVGREGCYCESITTPASTVIGDFILYRDSMGVDIEALRLIPSTDFDTSWSYSYEDHISDAEFVFRVTDEMIE